MPVKRELSRGGNVHQHFMRSPIVCKTAIGSNSETLRRKSRKAGQSPCPAFLSALADQMRISPIELFTESDGLGFGGKVCKAGETTGFQMPKE